MKYPQLAKRLPAKRAFITGAASGLGFAFSQALAQDGWTLGLTDVNERLLNEAAVKLRASGATVSSYCFDVSNFDAYAAAAQSFLETYSGVDVLINNAGIGCGGYLESISVEDWHRVIDINLMGSVYGCKLFLPAMKRDNNGHILNLASAAAIAEGPQCSPYNISKAGVVALSESMSSELVDFNIGITVFMPSFIRTNIGDATIGDPGVRDRAKAAVSGSALSAEWAVDQALRGVDAKKFYVVLPAEIKFLWLFKRLFPEPYLRFVATWAKKRSEQFDRSFKSNSAGT